jgi:hypothetical protein
MIDIKGDIKACLEEILNFLVDNKQSFLKSPFMQNIILQTTPIHDKNGIEDSLMNEMHNSGYLTTRKIEEILCNALIGDAL